MAAYAAGTAVGLVLYCCLYRRETMQRDNPSVDLFQPSRFLEHCISVAAGGMQIPLGVLESTDALSLRRRAEETGRYIEAIIDVPQRPQDTEQFEAEVRTAVAAGARAARTVIIPGRRYEYFDSLEKFREFQARGRAALERAAPIVEKHRLPLAVENHKNQRAGEQVALLQQISSLYVGACVDTGNNLALLEDPLDTVKTLAPWAHCVHLKDQAVRPFEDGFLLGDVPLGQGCLPLKQMVDTLRRARPGIRFSLELITRDPLRVPCLTEQYWATFPDTEAHELARMLRLVRQRSSDQLQQVNELPAQQRVALEDANVSASLTFARQQLEL